MLSNPLGVPDGGGPFTRLTRLLRHLAGARDLDSIDAQAWGDMEIVTHTWPGRWGAGLPAPERLRPADLLMMRGMACRMDAKSDVSPATRDTARGLPGVGTLARIAIDAVPFWVPGAVAAGLARTDIPELGADEIRLPAPTVSVWFGQPLAPPGTLTPPHLDALADEVMSETGQIVVPKDRPIPGELLSALTLTARGYSIDAQHIHGVVLLADDGGRPVDAMVWVIAQRMRGGERDGGWIWSLVPARPSLSVWPELWWGLCAVIAWGDWIADRPVVIHNRGKAKRLKLAGLDPSRIGPVRVMAARHRVALGAEREEPTSTHASPTTHLRRGHWRRQRVGPGRSRVEMRWIAPVVVNPGREGDWRETVFTLPPVASIPDTPLPNMFRKIEED